MLEKPFTTYITDSIIKNWNIHALADYGGESFTYAEVAAYVLRFHQLFDDLDIQPSDKIAIVGKNSARWCILYISIVTYGAVVVPILPDFKEEDLKKIINHSDSVLLFADDQMIRQMDCPEIDKVIGIFQINDFSMKKCVSETLQQAWEEAGLMDPIDPAQLSPENFIVQEIPNDWLAVISYTSGTTGFTKGVMLPHNSLAANIRFAQQNMPLKPGDNIVSFLPLAHTFGCAFEFLFPFTLGCHITILTRTPSPQVIMKAFGEIRPALVLSVPLVIEKIYKNRLLPEISKPHIRLLLALPGINALILKKIREKLNDSFGGNFHEVVMGGAPLNGEAELLFRKMKFRYTLGYGMTECGPLISYHGWKGLPRGSSGKLVDTLEIKVIKDDPHNRSGEIYVRGDNVMKGYYKNEEDTRKVLNGEGWLHTGDLGFVDEKGFLFIRGRSKSMILGANGKNIYPEEIESMINNRPGVGESLVVEREGKLVALVYPDPDHVRKEKLDERALIKLLEHHRKALNHTLPKYMNLSTMELHPEEFAKTPKRNIKRFLYE